MLQRKRRKEEARKKSIVINLMLNREIKILIVKNRYKGIRIQIAKTTKTDDV